MRPPSLSRHLVGVIVSLSMFPCLGLPVSAGQLTPSCHDAVPAFVSRPTEGRRAALAEVDREGCWSVVESSNATLTELNRRVSSGNGAAAEYLAGHLKQLDGGNLEDALIALGEFSDHDMQRLLRFARQGLLSKVELADALTMLPLELSADRAALLKRLAARKNRVMRVPRKDLSEQKREALTAIDAFAAEIRSTNP